MRVGFEAELGAGLADGGGGVAEGWVGAGALGFGSERAGVRGRARCRCGGGRSRWRVRRAPTTRRAAWFSGRGPRTAVTCSGGSLCAARTSWRSALAFALGEFFVHGAEVADLLGVAVDPGDRVVVRALRGDLLDRVGVATRSMYSRWPWCASSWPRSSSPWCAVAFEEPSRSSSAVRLRDASFGAREVFAQALASSPRPSSLRAWGPGSRPAPSGRGRARLRSSARGERARPGAGGFVEASALARLAPRWSVEARDGVFGGRGGSVGPLAVAGVGLGGEVEVGLVAGAGGDGVAASW